MISQRAWSKRPFPRRPSAVVPQAVGERGGDPFRRRPPAARMPSVNPPGMMAQSGLPWLTFPLPTPPPGSGIRELSRRKGGKLP